MKNVWKKNEASKKGQGALEYLLLIGGAVLIATIVLLVIIGSTGSTNDIINNNLGVYQTHVTLGGTGGGSSSLCVGGSPDGTRTGSEECDTLDFGAASCATELGSGYTGNLSCNQNCQIVTSACVPPAASMASFASVDWDTMTPVVFAPITNATTTNGWTLVNMGTSNIVINSIVPTFSGGVTLNTISLDGNPIYSGSLSSTASTGQLNGPTGVVVTPGAHIMDLSFSGAVHSLTVNNSIWLQFTFSDASTYNSPILQDVVFSLGPTNGYCIGTALTSTTGGVTLNGSVTDRDVSGTDYGFVTHFTTSTVSPAPIGVAYASLRVFNSASQTGSTDHEYFKTLTPAEYSTPCVSGGFDAVPDSGLPAGYSSYTMQPVDETANRNRYFDVESIVSPSTTDLYLAMTGEDTDNSGIFRTYQSGLSTSNAPVLLAGFILPAP